MGREGRIRVTLRPGLLALVLLFTWAGGAWSELWGGGAPLQDGVVFLGLMLLGVLAHEGGHVLAGELGGHPLQELKLKFRPAVRLVGTPLRWRRALISLAGPLGEGVVGGVVLAVAWHLGPATSVEVLAGGLMVLNALAGLLPLGRRSDGWKAWRGVKESILPMVRPEQAAPEVLPAR